jgi:hypothetical protein
MKRAVVWVAEYEARGAPGPVAVFERLFTHYPQLFRTRADALAQIFFTCGSGFDWLDGAIIACTEGEDEPHERPSPFGSFREDVQAALDDMPPERAAALREQFGSILEPKAPLLIGPVEDDGARRTFHFRDGASNVAIVPPDVRDDWLAVAYEAATVLRDRSSDPDGRHVGARVVTELQRRFRDRLEDRVR